MVSDNVFNDRSNRVTVVPLTHYDWIEKRDRLARWSVAVVPDDPGCGLIPVSTGRGTRRGSPAHKTRYLPRIPYNDDLSLIQNLEDKLKFLRARADNSDAPWKPSLIDCAQLCTLFCAQPDRRADLHPSLAMPLGQLDDLKRDFKRAALTKEAILHVESILQTVLAGEIRLFPEGIRSDHRVRERELPHQQGDVVRIELPSRANQIALIVSSTSIDYLRSLVLARGGRQFELITVVPLTRGKRTKNTSPAVMVGDTEMSALCQEIYTVYWPARDITPIGRLPADDMSRVRAALRIYLNLPLPTPASMPRAQ